jgi:glycosyltransferase involved in cell wall biosynthesis
MKVVHVTPTYFSPASVVAGGERFTQELAKAMGRYVDTEVVSFGVEPGKVILSDKVTMRIYRRWIKNRGLTNPINLFFLRSLLNADIIHCHQYHTIATNLSIILGRLFGKKVFVTEMGGGGRNLAFYVNMTRWLDGYLVLSQNSADLETACRARIHIIYAGVDVELYKPTRPKEQKIIFVGRFIPNKGIDVLIEAMPPDVLLHVIGTPYDQRYYEDLKRLANGKKVSFLTGLSDGEIVDEYSSAMACVLPAVITNRYGGVSFNAQLFALPLVEAMACETVPIATNIFAHPEIIENGVTGFLVPPNEPEALRERIEYVLAQPRESEEMGKRGREVVLKRFTWDAVARRCLEAYVVAVRRKNRMSVIVL